MAPSHPSTPVVLIVDDHADTREMYTEYLKSMGLATRQATTCAAALATVARERIDAIVLDRRLPDGDGAEVCRALRADLSTRGIPIVMISGKPDDGSTPADAYLLKPVMPDVLYGEVARLTGAAG